MVLLLSTRRGVKGKGHVSERLLEYLVAIHSSDFSWQASQVPLGRMLPFCSSYGTRVACWGGFNSQKAEVLTDVAIFWTGLHRITVSQSLRLQGEDVDSVSEWADLEPAWRRGEENNKRCTLDPYHACG